MKWIQNISRSVYDPAFYRSVQTEKIGVSVTYFLGLMLVVSLLSAISSYVTIGSWWFQGDRPDAVRQAIVNMFPENLVLEYRDGHVMSNVDEPFFVPMPAALRDSASSGADENPASNFAVIDTKGTIVPEDFSRFDTLTIVGNTALWVNDPQKGIRVVSFDSWSKEPFTLDRAAVSGFADTLMRILVPVVIVGLILLPLLIMFGISIGYLLYLLFGAFVVLVVAKIRKLDITYAQSYRLGLHLITVPAAYSLLGSVLGIPNVPFLFTLMLAVFAYVNLVPSVDVPVGSKVESAPEKI